VTLCEAGHYPRHKVCGEFISGRGQETIRRLGLSDVLEKAGAMHGRTAAFFAPKVSTAKRVLPVEAICLSRYEMDDGLAKHFKKLGGVLCEGRRWQNNEMEEGVIHATGRRLHTNTDGERWFGMKIHTKARAVVEADLELHVVPNGYVGLCRINNNRINICGLFRQMSNGDRPLHARDLLLGDPDSTLRKRIGNAEFNEESFCAIAGLSLSPQKAVEKAELNIGDAITMIPPATGNGMSMAFESAEIAIEPVLNWSRGNVSWGEARQAIAARCDKAFRARLRWARWLQRAMLHPVFQQAAMFAVSRSETFWRRAFEKTR
jgi:flavin-dependent dehydrogenase